MNKPRRFATWLLLILCLACAGARADTPIALFKSYAGNLNFVGTQKTMRTASNTVNPCSVVTSGTTLTATLSGIPSGATVVSAHLYWAGSNTVADYTVRFDGALVTAPSVRRFTSDTGGSSIYFSGAVDVTAQVIAKGNADYTFSELNINSSSLYCNTQEVLGGFSLLVIYSHPGQTYRVLNLYEGFQYIRTFGADNSQVSLSLSNFQIPNPLGTATGRIGHITWEGDTSLAGSGEELRFNGTEIVDGNNPTGNQFNSYSNINGDGVSYGIDFDAYTLSSPIIQSGQTSATTSYKSGQDLVLLSAEIIAVPNVPVADLQLAMVRGGVADRGASITFTSTASNLGPSTDTGPIQIKTTLGPGLTYVSGVGTGWTCSAAAQVVTCTNPAALAMGDSLPAVVLSATIDSDAPATITSIGELTGALYDNVAENNVVEDKIVMASDMQITMTLQNPPLTLGQQNAFLVTVKNNGPTTETSPVEVTSILPSTLRYLSFGGTNWTCSAAGQLLTCTYNGQLASGVEAPLLTVNFSVLTYAATVNATLTVDGAGSDSFTGNDSATLSMDMTLPRWVFTDAEFACVHNRSFASSFQKCKVMDWGTITAGAIVKVRLTNLNTSGVPTRFNNGNNTTMSISFALVCHNPSTSAGTLATFDGSTLKACAPDDLEPDFATAAEWVAMNLTFPAGSPSTAELEFKYEDVGRIELFVKTTSTPANNGASGPFISKPLKFVLSTVGNGYTTILNDLSPVFSLAGAPFPLTVTALTGNLVPAKNFGREIVPETIALSEAAAIDSETLVAFEDMDHLPEVAGNFDGFSNGAASGAAFTWDEAGILDIKAGLADADYIGSGPVSGDPLTVGRFVPNHFTTAVTVGMACTTAQNAAVACNGRGMHYSGQPITTTVTAYGRGGTVLQNFQGKFARPVTLSAAASQGGTVLAGTAGTLGNAALAANNFALGVATPAISPIPPATPPAFTLPTPYLNNGINGGFSAPLDVFLRASYAETAPATITISSLRAPAAASVEGGTRIVVGRIYVPHSYGSELLKRLVVLKAQYWTGTRWEVSSTDDVTSNLLAPDFISCAGFPCTPGLADRTLLTAGPVMNGGTATYRFNFSGANNIGIANVKVEGPAWLPSSTGRWRYGIYKPTPVIYIREVF